MAWNEIHITTHAEQADELSDQLSSAGACAITFHDAGNHPIFEPTKDTPRIWEKTTVVALFDHEINLTPILQQLAMHDIKTVEVADEDWVRRSLDSFKPMKFGKNLWVCPSWQTPPEPEAINLTLDPGLAFGTGSHATTALCLDWLAENIDKEQIVIDYGCGSGILGIAALKLGAKQVLAVDNDTQALESATHNSQENGLHPTVFTTFLPEDLPDIQADLVIANILAQPLINLAEKLAKSTKIGGKILLSGILTDQIEAIHSAYKHWYTIQQPVCEGEWVSLVGIRANNI